MSTFDAVRNRKRGEEAKQRVLDRVYNSKQTEAEPESQFTAVRNRKITMEPAVTAPVDTSKGTPSSDLVQRFGGVANSPGVSKVLSLQKDLVMPPVNMQRPAPVAQPKDNGGFASGFNAFTDRVVKSATFGLSDLIGDLVGNASNDEYKEFEQQRQQRAENVKGGLAADIIGSLVPGEMTYRAASHLVNPAIKNAPKSVQALTRGAAGGALFQAASEAGDMANGGDQSLAGRAKDIALATAIGGAGDAALSGLGSAFRAIRNRRGGTQVAESAAQAVPESVPVQRIEPQPTVTAAATEPVQPVRPRIREEAPLSARDQQLIEADNLSQSQIDDLLQDSRQRVEMNQAAPEVNAQPMQQDMFTDLFGNQGLGISPTGSTRRVNAGPLTTADQIVSRAIKNDKEGIKQSIAANARATYQNFVDSLSPLKKIGDDIYEAAMDAQRANTIANTIARDKFVNLEGQVIGNSLEDIFKKVARGQDKQFVDYLTLRHAKTRLERGERVYAESLGMTPEKVQQRIEMLQQRYPGFEDIAKEWDQFNDTVLREIGVKEGLISPEAYNALREANPNYSPMRRQFKRSEKPGRSFIAKSTNSAFSGQKAPLKKVSPTGSVRDIVDPRRSTIESIGAWTNAAMRNRTMQQMVDAIKRDPEYFRSIAEIVQPPNKNNLQDILTNGGQDDFLESLNMEFADLFKRSKVDGDNIVRAMVNGQPVYMKVHDPEIVKALVGLGPKASNVLIDVLGAFSNATKRGATGVLAPFFAVKGATMDLAQSAIQARNPVKQAAYTVYSIFSGIGDSLNIPGLRNWAQEYRRAGGGYSAALRGDRQLDTRISSMTRDPLLSPKGIAKGVKNVAKIPVRALREIGDIAENAPRIAASKIERQRLGNEITPANIRKAMSAGREATVNFSRKGALTSDIEALVPYNNAAVQGTYRVLRGMKKNPVRTVAAIAGLSVMPKLYEYAKFHDDPDYQNLPARERMRFLIVNKNEDGTFTRIPMEPAYNTFGEMTIEALRYFQDNDPQAFKGSMDALANAWTPPLITGALQGLTQGTGAEGSIVGTINSTIAAPFVATAANKSFTGAPIVPQSVSDRSPQYQYDERTSSIAKQMGTALNMSPMKIDYILRAYGGDPARLVLPLTSDVGKGNARNTLLKNFIIDPAFSNTLTTDFYDAKEKLNQAYADYTDVGAELPSWYNDSLRKALNSTAKGSVSKKLSQLRDAKKQLTADKSIPDKERTKQIRDIQQQINEIYIDINSTLREAGVIE